MATRSSSSWGRQLFWHLSSSCGICRGAYTLHAAGQGWLLTPLILKDRLEEMVWGKAGSLQSCFVLTCRASTLSQLDGGRRAVKIEAPLKGRGGTAFLMGRHSLITSRDVMVNKPQSTLLFFFPSSFCPSIWKEAERISAFNSDLWKHLASHESLAQPSHTLCCPNKLYEGMFFTFPVKHV